MQTASISPELRIGPKYFSEAIAAVAKIGPWFKPAGRCALSEALFAN